MTRSRTDVVPSVASRAVASSTRRWLLLAFAAVLLFDALSNPAFFVLRVVDGRLTGSLVDVLDRALPLVLVSLGMTLVVATGGVDLSVGAVMAVAGSLAGVLVVGQGWHPLLALAATLGVCALAGAWNGWLVTRLGIQPIVATLALMVAGRGAAQLFTDGQVLALGDAEPFATLDRAGALGLPAPVLLLVASVVVAQLLVRGSALGLLVEAIGANETASRVAGLPVDGLRIAVYAACGACAGLAGLVQAADIRAADANTAGVAVELDAILAVVLGGTALRGGRFGLLGSVAGALLVQTVTTSMLMTRVGGRSLPPEANLVVKALVVLLVCLLAARRRGDAA